MKRYREFIINKDYIHPMCGDILFCNQIYDKSRRIIYVCKSSTKDDDGYLMYGTNFNKLHKLKSTGGFNKKFHTFKYTRAVLTERLK